MKTPHQRTRSISPKIFSECSVGEYSFRGFLVLGLAILLFASQASAQNSAYSPSTDSQGTTHACGISSDGSACSPLIQNEFATSDASGNDAASAGDDSDNQDDWVHRWLSAVDKAREEQPHYVAPLITTHVLLVQQFRFDTYYQAGPTGAETENYGAMKGLEIIPNTRMEVQVGIPPYIEHEAPNMPNGFGDVSIFLKFRIISAPEETGGYFVGFFLGGSFPTGAPPNGMNHTVWTPMIAAAKRWRFFDWQTNLAGVLPQSGTDVLGRQILFNNTLQFSIGKYIWPEVEANSTFFVDGPHSGDNQTFLTPGLLIGPFRVAERLHFEIGGGVQTAVTHFHQYNHRWIWTARFPF
jgi:hypothetical protein